MQINSVLIDTRTSDEVFARALAEISAAKILGLDCETQDEARHAGLNAFNNKKRHVFDHRRTTMTGFSFYADGSDTAWYVNLAHADVDNCLPRDRALALLGARSVDCILIAHNAPFELVMFEACLGLKLTNVICTLQMAVTHHGPDEYPLQKFFDTPLSAIKPLAKGILEAFASYDSSTKGRSLGSTQQDLLGKFISKTSKAAHSYNGFVGDIAIGYNLKKLTKSVFGYQMTTYEEVLKAHGAKHMGELTGEQVVAYGADDAFWAVQHFKQMKDDLLRTNPAVLKTFLTQENPMIYVYAESWRDGLRLDLDEVYVRQAHERREMAKVLRLFKKQIVALLPFPDEPSAELVKRQADWYIGYPKGDLTQPRNNYIKKRQQITEWATSPDSDDDFTQCFQASNPIGNAWAIEKGMKLPPSGAKLNLVHYHGMRTILHDLMGLPLVWIDGAVTTDAEARGKMMLKAEAAEDEKIIALLKSFQTMSDIEQRMKLYLTPYTQLMDPETSRVYAQLSSMLASRRMAMRDPNGMQLSKQGESTYVRGFFLGDTDDHVVVSADWSSVELVEIGDFSGDPEFAKVFGQIPYGDLHSGAAADCLAVKTLPGLTEEEFREFKFGRNPNNRRLLNVFTGVEMEPRKYYSHTRGTPVGKGANFNYWYSGSLSTIAGNLGWTSDEMWEATDRYRTRFAVAEAWRVGVQNEAINNGFVTLPDHHRRVRVEATGMWHNAMMRKFADISAAPAMMEYAELALKRIQSRAKNQIVNSLIQGSCATLAKRSILRLRELVTEAGIADQVRFMMPIHDELVYSVHRDVVMIFIPLLRQAMTEHKDIIKTLPLACTVAIGKTFKPFDFKRPALTQIELDEASPIEGVIPQELEGQKLDDDMVRRVIAFIADAKVAA